MANLNTYKYYHDYGLPYPNAGDKTSLYANIEYLYHKIENCTRNITYFDLYKINSVLNNAAEFESKVNALPPYSSMVLNTSVSLTGANTSYNIGDIVIKNIDGTHEVIAAQRGGIFYPSSIQKTNTSDSENFTYDFMFSYQSAEPSVDKIIVEDKNTTSDTPGGDATLEEPDGIWNVDDLKTAENNDTPSSLFAKNILFKGLKSGTPSAPYNQIIALEDSQTKIDDISIEASCTYDEDGQKVEDSYIAPSVHCYYSCDGVNEEIYSDVSITFDEDDEEYVVKLNIETAICNLVVVK